MARRQRGEGSLHRRADGLWCAQVDVGYRAGKRLRRTVYGKTQAETVKKLRELRRQVEAGRIDVDSVTVEAWLRHWLATHVEPNLKPRTANTYRSYVDQHLIPALGRHRLAKLTPVHVREMHQRVLEGRSSTTALHAHRILSAALQAAVRDEVIGRNVATIVKPPARAALTDDGLTSAQAVTLLATVGDRPNASRWWAALLFGTRQGECLGLTWDAVDFASGTVDILWSLQRVPYRHGCSPSCGRRWGSLCPQRRLVIPAGYANRHLTGNLHLLRPKNSRPRRLMLIPAMAAALELHRSLIADQPNPHGLVWHRPDGLPLDPRQDAEQWHALLEEAGLPSVPLHDARHVAATLMLELGVPAKVSESILGHSSAAMTRAYQRVDDRLMLEALTRLGDRLELPAAASASDAAG